MILFILLMFLGWRIFSVSLYLKNLFHPSFLLPFAYEIIFIYPVAISYYLDFYTSVYALAYFSLIYISFFCWFIGLPYGRKTKVSHAIGLEASSIKVLLVLLTLFYLTAVLYQVKSTFGFSNSIFFVANQNAVNRYAGELSVSILYKLAIPLAFLQAFISGWFIVRCKNKIYVAYCLMFLVPALLDSMLMAARAGLLMMLSVFFTALYARVLRERITVPIRGSIILKFGGLVFLLFLFFTFIQFLRSGGTASFFGVIEHLMTWFFGYISAFSYWFDNLRGESVAYGAYTLAGISDLLGFKEKIGGMYLPVEIGSGRLTNVFSIFRGLIEDFTLLGSVLLVSTAGLIFRIGFELSRNGYIGVPLMVVVLMFMSWSFVISIATYNSVVFGLFLGVVFLYVMERGRLLRVC